MKKRLFLVDYRENEESKHQCIEAIQQSNISDKEIIAACHIYVGKQTELDGVVEVLADMTAEELEKIALTPDSLLLPIRFLYMNVKEIQRCAEILKGVNQ